MTRYGHLHEWKCRAGHCARQWGSRNGLPYRDRNVAVYFHGKKSKELRSVIPRRAAPLRQRVQSVVYWLWIV